MPFVSPREIQAIEDKTSDWFLRNLRKTFKEQAIPNESKQRLVFKASTTWAYAFGSFVYSEDSARHYIQNANRALEPTGWTVKDWSVEHTVKTWEVKEESDNVELYGWNRDWKQYFNNLEQIQLPSGHFMDLTGHSPVILTGRKKTVKYGYETKTIETKDARLPESPTQRTERRRLVVYLEYIGEPSI